MNQRDMVLYSYLKGKEGGEGELTLKSGSSNSSLLRSASDYVPEISTDFYVEEGDFIFFIVMSRSNITQYPSECSLLFKTETASAQDDNQFVSVYTMEAQSSQEFYATFRQKSSSKRMALIYIIFSNLGYKCR